MNSLDNKAQSKQARTNNQITTGTSFGGDPYVLYS